MYTKEQVIKGLQCCIIRDPDDKPRCNDCPFDGNCVNRLKMAALEFLIKSDFEVMEEIFYKANKTICGEYTAANGHHVLEIHLRLDDDYRALIRFDEEGNIL